MQKITKQEYIQFCRIEGRRHREIDPILVHIYALKSGEGFLFTKEEWTMKSKPSVMLNSIMKRADDTRRFISVWSKDKEEVAFLRDK